MNSYIATHISANPANEDIFDLVAAFLAEVGYESFESDASGMTAYIAVDNFSDGLADKALADFPMDTRFLIKHEHIEGKDWNEEWEKHYFQPIVLDGRCVVHSSFHKDVPDAEYDIVIDPKMSFGTGHHATTSMMVRQVLDIAGEKGLAGAGVIDMGTGTGILAILCKMCGANHVYGIEIDGTACGNAVDNAALNNVDIEIIHGDSAKLENLPQADMFLANINRNVILADMERYVKAIKSGGFLVLSGFYETDVPLVEMSANTYNLKLVKKFTDPEGWVSLRFQK